MCSFSARLCYSIPQCDCCQCCLLFRCFPTAFSLYKSKIYFYIFIETTTKKYSKCERVNKYKTMITHLYDYAYIHTV